MPDLSNMVPFHSKQVRKLYLLVSGRDEINLQFCILYLVIFMNSHKCVENSMNPDQLASGFVIVYVWFHTVLKGAYARLSSEGFT